MFRHLRNRLIAINLIVTTIVLAVAFSSIYMVALSEAQHRRSVIADIVPGYTQIVIQTIDKQIQAEQRESLNTLLVSLFVAGVAVEFSVAILSYVLAEAAIRPIKETYDSQKAFIANASHEMKTPIAAIMANLEVADIQDNPWIDNVTHEVKYMADLNQDLLALTRAENTLVEKKVTETVILKEFVEEIIAPFKPRINQKKVKFAFKTQMTSGRVKIVKNDFRQVVTILMDNALKYCDKEVSLVLTKNSLAISNDGAKISEEDALRVFDRFYQTNKSSEGVGLGLAIAKTLAEHNNWKLAVKPGEMTEFKLEF